MSYTAESKTQQLMRIKFNMLEKAGQLTRLYCADLALITRKNGRYHKYRSTDHESWPSHITDIVCIESICRHKTNLSLKSVVSFARQSVLKRPGKLYVKHRKRWSRMFQQARQSIMPLTFLPSCFQHSPVNNPYFQRPWVSALPRPRMIP